MIFVVFNFVDDLDTKHLLKFCNPHWVLQCSNEILHCPALAETKLLSPRLTEGNVEHNRASLETCLASALPRAKYVEKCSSIVSVYDVLLTD